MSNRISPLRIALLTGGIDKHYACGLSQSLGTSGVMVDVVCNEEMSEEIQGSANLNSIAIYPMLQRKSRLGKLIAIFVFYAQLLKYSTTSSASIFHILWNYKFRFFDRTLFLIYCKLLGKEVVFTAHNVNKGVRDGSDSLFNRLSLRIQYQLVDHLFVHTQKMKDQLVEDFHVQEEKVSIIPFGTYEMVPQSAVTAEEARQRLGLRDSDRTILFFGHIAPYKGIDLLVEAFSRIAPRDESYRLVIAGGPMKEAEEQWRCVKQGIDQSPIRAQIIQHDHFIGDNEIELYFKSADVLVLPYTQIYQSGVLFMAYTFGLPVIATDIGSFGRDVVEGATGYLCRPNDPEDLAKVIESYFSSKLFAEIDEAHERIKRFVQASNSWDIVAAKTGEVYRQLSHVKVLEQAV